MSLSSKFKCIIYIDHLFCYFAEIQRAGTITLEFFAYAYENSASCREQVKIQLGIQAYSAAPFAYSIRIQHGAVSVITFPYRCSFLWEKRTNPQQRGKSGLQALIWQFRPRKKYKLKDYCVQERRQQNLIIRKSPSTNQHSLMKQWQRNARENRET